MEGREINLAEATENSNEITKESIAKKTVVEVVVTKLKKPYFQKLKLEQEISSHPAPRMLSRSS